MKKHNSLKDQSVIVTNVTYAYLLGTVIEARRRAGKSWKQEEIAVETNICKRNLQYYISAEKLPAQEERNRLAIVLECPQLRNVPPHLPNPEEVKGRFGNEIAGIPNFLAHRGQKMMVSILRIAEGFNNACTPFMQAQYDLELHQLPAHYHPDSEIHTVLYWQQKSLIYYYADWAPYLCINEIREAAPSHTETHRGIINSFHTGTKEDITGALEDHRDILMKKVKCVYDFCKEKTHHIRWGNMNLGKKN